MGILKKLKSSNTLETEGYPLKGKLFYIGLLVSFIAAGTAHYLHLDTTMQFVIACIAIVFVAGFLGKATESVAHYAGERMGGFLNATFGNAAELIIAFFLVRDGSIRCGKSEPHRCHYREFAARSWIKYFRWRLKI